MLTQKQRELLVFIHERTLKDGVPPSFEEMKESIGLKSKSGIHRLITALEERGYLQRLPNRARALEVTKLPENYGNRAVHPKLQETKIHTQPVLQKITQSLSEIVNLPLMGKIAAGTPIEAIRDEGSNIDVPASMLGKGEHYALRVEGDSMIKAGIHDGDVVIIRKSNTARPDGRIVVALVDGQEVTLKRLRADSGKIVLEPENDLYKPRVLTADRVQIQGELASLIRTYH